MRRRLGQHFLKNKSAVQKIISALELQQNETIIEIGPGTGALTFPLLKECKLKNCKLIAIEKDPQLSERLSHLVTKSLRIINGDALKILPNLMPQLLNDSIPNYKIVGNIPYYITGKLLRIISELDSKPSLTVLMIQKEVAERIIAQPPKMNLLAAATQFWAEPKILLTLKPNDFDPPPKVDSAVIRLVTRHESLGTGEIQAYYKLLHIIFKQPRKTLANNLSAGLDLSKKEIESVLGRSYISKNARPQDLSLEEIKALVTDFHS